MLGHGVAQSILLGGDRASLVACFALVASCGLLRPFGQRSRVKPARPPRTEHAVTPTIKLNAIELGLLAELSLEQARAYEEVAGDAAEWTETAQSAAASAQAWRERARTFQLHARHLGAEPIVPAEHASRAYTGPERRTQARRNQTRRTGAQASVGLDGADRRSVPDRRQGDRRRPELAHR